MESNEKKEARIGYLEKLARSNLYGLGLMASLGELQHDASMACDMTRILKLCGEHLEQLLDFQVMSFFLVSDDSGFELVQVNPESEKSDLQKEIDEQIENGSFAWAVNQNRPVVVKSKRYGKSLILHVLATKSKVRGMFAGILTREDKDIQETVLYPLSIILQNTSYAIEAASLHKLISDQNKNLEEIVQKRTQSLEEQTHELKQEVAYRRLAEESLVVAKEEAERAARAKSDFIANISHEFRTPLNAILGYCEILQYETKKFNRPDIIEDLKSIEVSGRHLLVLFNDILDFSKIQAGKMDLNLEDFKVLSLVEDVMSTIRPLARKNRNTISVTSQGNVRTMFSDSGRVRQVLLNLLGNACKFTEDGSVSLKVSSETMDQTEWLTFSVSDTGIGISQKMITQLFKEFTQAENSTARKYGGTGLGLAISRRLCQMLGGDITVKSEPGKGTVFIAKLPADATESGNGTGVIEASPSEAMTSLEAEEFQKPSASQQEDAALSSGKNNETLLAINNDPAECDLIRRFMEMEGFRVYTALNASEGLRLAHEVHPDVISLDVLMSEIEGWMVLSQLKEDPRLAPIPVVMLSVEDEKEKAIELGASDLLTKPIEWDQFLEVVKRQMKPRSIVSPILVVEDDATNRGALCRVLRREGLVVLEAVDGNAAMSLTETETPGLIILDLILPEFNGFDVLSEISKNDNWKHIPIIVITAKELSNEELKRLKKEVDCIFQKGDYSRNDLLKEIHTLTAKPSYPA
ncbi:MAG: response regulator [Nitrospinae bacterium]|jgi:signal transduction histidine kinase/DNA-binding response OmpR family regulator|nr:response regulator [Nitrospinota bacterium]MDA1110750.1 response regulator [Nitrospinota bacterium]